MADWTTLADSQLDPDAPLTSELAYAWRDNPIAIAEGAAGAPKVVGQALSGVYLATLSTTTTSPIGVVGVDRARQFSIQSYSAYAGFTGANRNIQARYTSDNGVSWGAWQGVFSVIPPGGGNNGWRNFNFSVDVVNGQFSVAGSGRQVGDFVIVYETGSHTVPAGCNGVQIRWDTSGMPMSSVFYCLGGAA